MSYEREAARVWLLPFPPLCRPLFIGPASELLRDVSFTLYPSFLVSTQS